MPAILDGRLRAPFWNGPLDNSRVPGVPIAPEALPGVKLANPWLGLFAPRATPEPLARQLPADHARFGSLIVGLGIRGE